MEKARRGRSPRMVTALMMALLGAGLFYLFLRQDVPGRRDGEVPLSLILRYVVTMGLGGALAGGLLSALFGRNGVLGWILAAIGGVLATIAAGLLGSALGLLPDVLADGWSMSDLIPIAYGLAVLPLALVGRPWLLVAWAVVVLLTHLWAMRVRARP